MRYLLDSDALSDLYEPEAPGHEGMTQQLASLESSDQVFISILALYELDIQRLHTGLKLESWR
jgi:hypothetical protein